MTATEISLQWGRTFSSAESQLDQLQTRTSPPKLQWGRTFSSAESLDGGDDTDSPQVTLQWGRTFSSAESLQFFILLLRQNLIFNGAALFQVRKVSYLATR